ncbi:hypothetical protein EIC82_22585 [Enterobacter sp. A11]|uniref:hypothetical protein n=1 Tax=unclassified Enterobacter TaxID=2608935 RepID=UPI00106F307D|nr:MULTISPECIES: hypothetical protein [unclassified Enterobacter]MBM1024057.1 hypothetical protein [Enterobacter sp. E1]MEA3565677.1 hypothetical protein [Enterobacter sp. GM-22]MEA3599058.1 hypothetical protein [Enterobacter sp. GM-31]TFF54013.1 hypothetical protein EIC82_22585 [Enterobacter sp. A11]
MLNSLTLQALATSGSGMILDARNHTSLELQTIAGIAGNRSTSGAPITIRNASSLQSLTLQAIATASKGRVIFDFTS